MSAKYTSDDEVAHPVLGLLPPVLHVPSSRPSAGPWLRSPLDLLAQEARPGAGTGAATVVVRLLDVLLVLVVRSWLDGTSDHTDEDRRLQDLLPQDGPQASWLRGLRDPVTAQRLALLHEHPAHDWTLQALAAAAQVPRVTLARSFTHHVGEPPLSYLTRWCVELAARRLRKTTLPAAVVARKVGYTPEYASTGAFARLRAHLPGRYRHSRQGPPKVGQPVLQQCAAD